MAAQNPGKISTAIATNIFIMSEKMKNKNTATKKTLSIYHSVTDAFSRIIDLHYFLGAISLIGCLLYYALIIHPEYIHFSQHPVFFLQKKFFLELLNMPGGLTDFVSACITELYQFGWIGALILTAFLAIFYILLSSLIKPKVWWVTPVIPVILLAVAQANQYYFIVKTLSILFGLGGFIIYKNISIANIWIRSALTALLMIVVYLLSPGAMLICALLILLQNIFKKDIPLLHRIVFSSGIFIFALFIPWFASKELFIISLSSAYLRHTPMWLIEPSEIPPLEKIYVELSALAIATLFVSISVIRIKSRNTLKSAKLKNAVQIAFVLLLIGVGIWKTAYHEEKEFLSIRYKAHVGDWVGVASHLNDRSTLNFINLFHFNRAYYHLNKFASEFFSIRQNWNDYGIIPQKNSWYRYPLDYSDFTLELGHVNESKRWAFESLTYYGESAEVLKRLAITHIIEGNALGARKFLNRLNQNPFYSSWAKHYLACIDNPALLRNEPELQRLHAATPKKDFIVKDNRLELDLREMLDQYPRNKMANQFLLMHSLVALETNNFAYNFFRYQINKTKPIPRHFEEALIVFLSTRPGTEAMVSKLGIKKEILDRYKTFHSLLQQYRTNPKSTYEKLYYEYGNTYWFYLVFKKPKA